MAQGNGILSLLSANQTTRNLAGSNSIPLVAVNHYLQCLINRILYYLFSSPELGVSSDFLAFSDFCSRSVDGGLEEGLLSKLRLSFNFSICDFDKAKHISPLPCLAIKFMLLELHF